MSDQFRIRRTTGQAHLEDLRRAAEILHDWGNVASAPADNAEAKFHASVAHHVSRYGRVAGAADDISEIEAIVKLRFCGVADPVSGNINVLVYGSAHGWDKVALTYAVNSANSGMTQSAVDATVRSVFDAWQTACPKLSFSKVVSAADLNISFGGMNLDQRFGSAGGVAGAAAYPTAGTINLDSSESWSPAFLNSILLHEIGHALGLSHSTDRKSLMYPFALNSTIDAETKTAINILYGFQPQQRLGDRGTVDGPALALAGKADWVGQSIQYQGRMFMFWRGADGDDALYWSVMDSAGWSAQRQITGFGSSHGPAATSLVVSGGEIPAIGLLMVWKGVSDDTTIYYAINRDPTNFVNGSWSPADWTAQQSVSGVGTSDSPSVAGLGSQVLMAWKGISGDNSIYYATFDGNNWGAQQSVNGVGTSSGPFLVAASNWAMPSGRVYMLWKGIPGDSGIYYTHLDSSPASIWDGQQLVQYPDVQTNGTAMIAAGTTSEPSGIYRDGGDIMMAWKGIQGDSSIYCAQFFKDQWSGQIQVPGVGTSARPAICALSGQVVLAWKGIQGDSSIYYTTLG